MSWTTHRILPVLISLICTTNYGFPGIKRPGRDVDPPPRRLLTEVVNEWSVTSTSLPPSTPLLVLSRHVNGLTLRYEL